jgi:hypothetical protein
MTNFQARHGDLLVERVDKLPKKLKESKDKVIIAGLSSGHNHILEGKARIYKSEDKTFIEVTGKANLNHEEHGKIELPKGV